MKYMGSNGASQKQVSFRPASPAKMGEWGREIWAVLGRGGGGGGVSRVCKRWETLSQVSQWSYSGDINPFLAAPLLPRPQGSDLEGTGTKTYFLLVPTRRGAWQGMRMTLNGVSDHNGSCRVQAAALSRKTEAKAQQAGCPVTA